MGGRGSWPVPLPSPGPGGGSASPTRWARVCVPSCSLLQSIYALLAPRSRGASSSHLDGARWRARGPAELAGAFCGIVQPWGLLGFFLFLTLCIIFP